MSDKKNYTAFNPLTVPLQGSNLIEASAGTGKTYSIAIMVLRLVLEKKLNVKEILMVTFTKAAVAELEERIRLFIRSAARASQGTAIGDNTIRELVEAAIAAEGPEEVQRRLREAILFLDETSVLTIHSFCQQALSEFAFETGQVFGAETMQDITPVLAEQINQFWRTKITTLPLELLSLLHERGVSQEAILRILKEHLNGKKYIAFEPGKAYDCEDVTYAGWLKELRELKEAEEKLRECLESDVVGMRADLEKRCEKGNAKRYLSHLLDNVPEFLAYIGDKRSAYIEKDFSDLLKRLDDCDEALAVYDAKLRDVMNHLYCLAIQQASSGILQYKLRKNLLSFDDMIFNLHKAVIREGSESLINSLRTKYKAVFIDEFQDTDRLQYEIFQKTFGEEHISFYIGDPKQSIYAWRKADIFTYFEARNAVHHFYGMNVNYRSSTSFIEAMNVFFGISDPFHFKDEKSSIEYINVDTFTKCERAAVKAFSTGSSYQHFPASK
jgi:exodeoxyribonuclease V beta subunit